MNPEFEQAVDAEREERDSIGPQTRGDVRGAVDAAIAMLDRGEARIAEKTADGWIVHQWLKKAVLLSFRLNPMEAIAGGPGGAAIGAAANAGLRKPLGPRAAKSYRVTGPGQEPKVEVVSREAAPAVPPAPAPAPPSNGPAPAPSTDTMTMPPPG
jgi:hypothetical protein